MIRITQTFLFILVFSVSLFAEEDIYTYKFDLDTTITGKLVAEGHIFPNYANAYLVIENSLKDKNGISKTYFYDEKFHVIHKIELGDPYSDFIGDPLLFDFDNDGFEEVVFAIRKNDKIVFTYFNPSGGTKNLIDLFSIYIGRINRIHILLTPVQLDDDRGFELLVSLSPTYSRGVSANGLWTFDFKKAKILWKIPSAEYLIKTYPVNLFENKNTPYLIYSTYGINYGLYYSNNHYFKKNLREKIKAFDNHFVEINDVVLDSSAHDYTCDSVSYLKKIDSNGNLIWSRRLGGAYVNTEINKINKNGIELILLIIYDSRRKSNFENAIEIINPTTGKILNHVKINSKLHDYIVLKDKIFVFLNSGEVLEYDFDFNLIQRNKLGKKYRPYSVLNYNKHNYLFATEGSGDYQKFLLFDENFKKSAKMELRGVPNFFYKSKFISIYNSINEESKIFRIGEIPWYDRISLTLLRNIAISFLTILLLTMLLWINTLRVSSKKINRQKKEIEKTHAELKETTSKLIRSEKLAVYGTLASGIAHEINSPLGAIINSAQRIRNNPGSDLEKNIALIEKAGKRSKAIIEKLLVSTRVKGDNENTNMTDVLNDWKELSQRQFENLGIKFVANINCNQLLAISSTELNQIFTNLFYNARDAISDINGGDKIISISSEHQGNVCRILVRDTGPGFAKEKLVNPFEAFNTTKEKGKGTGLGLWVVKNIIENVNGQINIRNYENGAEVEIIIPLFEEKTNEKL